MNLVQPVGTRHTYASHRGAELNQKGEIEEATATTREEGNQSMQGTFPWYIEVT
jgi:hypothetical protein